METTKKQNAPTLERKLGPVSLWGLGVGFVISGMYFGWNLGLPVGGTLGLAIATLFIIVMYLCFTFSYTELACAIPKAGGAFVYGRKSHGNSFGFLAGMAQVVEFVFAPPAIAAAIGAYFHLFLPEYSTTSIAVVAYLLFTALNVSGVKTAARFELFVTILAVGELLIFSGVTLPKFEMSNLSINAFPNGIGGIFAAIPFAIWFFLAIEGVANVAEETINPQRNVLIGLGSAIFTLVVLAILTFVSSIGVGGWEAVVYPAPGAAATDSPLPLALTQIVGNSSFLYHMLIFIGLFGLVASFHGIILASGRAVYEMGKENFLPPVLGKISKKFHTPAVALIVNMFIGIIALFSGRTGEIITISVFGALTLYIVSMLSVLKLRKSAPELERPFKVPFFPLTPIVALIIAVISLVAVVYYNLQLAGIYVIIMAVSFAWFKIASYQKAKLGEEEVVSEVVTKD
ncbi:ethanolamine transporter [Paludibacter propionicigenes WB4]|uniref:Ethanolamine transporter n=1 Tax=Paludibacter propionicigenes (strain DSM 17365 / JCM 13257 / WB4) TaxID=694427 RepID=E4T0F9_PALPW|nr:ethanolamine permease [Paludibacter propionicigenes]ADQ78318.1 ethanolamine transporter [Paludibacter propionicigenes WB4]